MIPPLYPSVQKGCVCQEREFTSTPFTKTVQFKLVLITHFMLHLCNLGRRGERGRGRGRSRSNKNRRLPAGFSLLLTSHFSSLLHSAPTIFQSHQRAAPDITACVGLCSVGKRVEYPWSCNLPTRRLSSVHF